MITALACAEQFPKAVPRSQSFIFIRRILKQLPTAGNVWNGLYIGALPAPTSTSEWTLACAPVFSRASWGFRLLASQARACIPCRG